MKYCNKCNKSKPLECFGYDKSTRSRLSFYCKECRVHYVNKWWQRNPDYAKNTQLRRTFGITLEQYKVMFMAQNGACAICKKAETVTYRGKIRNLAVDHCHSTGKIRALLCAGCNQSLGHMKENFDVILSMAKYVQFHNHIV